ncbi:serine acetyltransferase [Paraburkholderia sp. Cy-641]|uniref:serine acetyltransferase n=1 Tax=Paraburkholderia sp. Cy-641 TaxID=2608337 RepID=UPI001421D6B5|nr:serine acetyltransferase [Paraburkholderia sp. Cy-641]NIF80122.1 serine acetyltransferase [Paraburkholderia sp. Cy-641]
MLGRLLAAPFGSIWNLKTICYRRRNGFSSKLARLVYQLYQYENNSSVAWNSSFAGEPCFPHGMKSIFISGDAKIGQNCVIFQQVTIGSITLSGSARNGAPTIGNNVYIGAGAKIVGNVVIGNNVRIGANAVVHRDVPDNSVVVAGEQKVIQKNSALDNRYFSSVGGQRMYFDNGKWIPCPSQERLQKTA